jgi:hypothetical protein
MYNRPGSYELDNRLNSYEPDNRIQSYEPDKDVVAINPVMYNESSFQDEDVIRFE